MRAAWLVAMAALAACDAGTQPSSGLEATLRVAGGTYFAGPTPAEADGPTVGDISSNSNNIYAGEIGKHIGGRLAHGGDALALELDNDTGYWIVPAGLPDVLMPDQLTFDVRMSFAATLTPGKHALHLRAVDADGHFGPASELVLAAKDAVAGKLDVQLTWDSEADLDLHLTLPGGVVVWANNINSYAAPPPPAQPDPAAAAAGGILDFDSNSQCVIDGRREENVIWTQAPPAGDYEARVDAFSLCGQPSAHWTMVVTLDGQVLGSASGTLGEEATRTAHDAAAGTLAVAFTVP
jgi:hypothetical protein